MAVNQTASARHAAADSQPTLHRVQANGISLAYWEWHPELRGREPTLLMVHATGFHGRVWDPVIQRLPARHIIALEQRGHGRSQTTEITGWPVFGRDTAAFVRELGLDGVVGIGHSMGAHALVQAAAYEPERFARLILCDPVILSPAAYHVEPPPPGSVHPAANRMNRFASAQAMMDRFEERAPYTIFDRAAFRAYCEHGLVPAADGDGLQLACAPITEANVYLTSRQNAGVYASVRALQIPVLIIRAKLPTAQRKTADYGSSPTWPGLVHEFRVGREVHLSEHSHLLLMQDPQRIAELIREELGLVDA